MALQNNAANHSRRAKRKVRCRGRCLFKPKTPYMGVHYALMADLGLC